MTKDEWWWAGGGGGSRPFQWTLQDSSFSYPSISFFYTAVPQHEMYLHIKMWFCFPSHHPSLLLFLLNSNFAFMLQNRSYNWVKKKKSTVKLNMLSLLNTFFLILEHWWIYSWNCVMLTELNILVCSPCHRLKDCLCRWWSQSLAIKYITSASLHNQGSWEFNSIHSSPISLLSG